MSQAMRPSSGICGSCRPHTHMEWPFPLDFLEIFNCPSGNDLHFVRERRPPVGAYNQTGFGVLYAVQTPGLRSGAGGRIAER